MDVSIDSRTIKPGQYFIPVKGENFDGRNFIDEVIAKGGIVLDEPLENVAKAYRKKLNAIVIGITGSAGKTTVKELLASVLGQRYRVEKTVDNQNNEIGVPLTILKADHQTEILLVECGIRKPQQMRFLASVLRPDMVVITNIGVSHMAYFESQRDLAKEKAALMVSALSWQTHDRVAFLNSETAWYSLLKNRAVSKQFQVLPFSGQNRWDGLMNLCYVVGRYFDLSEPDIQAGLSRYHCLSQRMEKTVLGSVTLIDDSYNANPDAMLFAFEQLRQMSGRKVLVLGDMLELGAGAGEMHRKVLEEAVESGFEVIFTIGPLFRSCADSFPVCTHFEDQSSLEEMLCHEVKAEDVVFIKGSRALKLEQLVSFLKTHLELKAL